MPDLYFFKTKEFNHSFLILFLDSTQSFSTQGYGDFVRKKMKHLKRNI